MGRIFSDGYQIGVIMAYQLDIVDQIIMWESGEMNNEQVLEFFSELVKTDRAWVLQGSYGRTARGLIDAGYLSEQGEILRNPDDA